MKCPACFNLLTELTVGKMTVDVCRGGCGGIWFDAFELQRVDEPGDSAGEWLINIERDLAVDVDPQLKRVCPRCEGIKLKRQFFSPKRRVEIDHCPGCAGYSLDAGELEKIRQENVATEKVGETSVISSAVLRYLYQIHTSDRP
jgi:Zn-finger nucleic acid-binding protein